VKDTELKEYSRNGKHKSLVDGLNYEESVCTMNDLKQNLPVSMSHIPAVWMRSGPDCFRQNEPSMTELKNGTF